MSPVKFGSNLFGLRWLEGDLSIWTPYNRAFMLQVCALYSQLHGNPWFLAACNCCLGMERPHTPHLVVFSISWAVVACEEPARTLLNNKAFRSIIYFSAELQTFKTFNNELYSRSNRLSTSVENSQGAILESFVSCNKLLEGSATSAAKCKVRPERSNCFKFLQNILSACVKNNYWSMIFRTLATLRHQCSIGKYSQGLD